MKSDKWNECSKLKMVSPVCEESESLVSLHQGCNVKFMNAISLEQMSRGLNNVS